jgi:hypothetical protein
MMLPENLSKKIEFLRKNPHVGLVHSKYHVIDQDGKILIPDTNWGHGTDRTVDSFDKSEDLLVAFINTINLPTVILTRACYEKVGELSDRIAFAYDWEYWMRISLYCDVAFLAEPLVKWRVHSSSVTKTDVRDPLVQLREDLMAKRELFKRHAHAIPQRRRLTNEMRRNMAERLFLDTQTMLKNGLGDAKVRAAVLKVCLSFPEMLQERSLWRLFLSSLLGRPVSGLMWQRP